ncbi:guanine deaminase, partial [Metarhizium majus ARSEF 297]
MVAVLGHLNLVLGDPFLTINDIPFSTLNHTADGLGEAVCIGANSGMQTGNPVLHGEVAAISNCSKILTDPNGKYKLTAQESIAAFAELSLYTNAESCTMCASALEWAGFKEYIYGTSIDTLTKHGWTQIQIPSVEVLRQSFDLQTNTRLIPGILANETDPYFLWQYNPAEKCPKNCVRSNATCTAQNTQNSTNASVV